MENVQELTKPKEKEANSDFKFKTPAEIQDFSNDAEKQEKLNDLWNQNLTGFTNQGILNNPWNTENTPEATNYFNPANSEYPSATPTFIPWSPFPGRISYNFPNIPNEWNKLADTGEMPENISNDPCNAGQGEPVPYFPYGPRGWQDEYCEWAVTRNEAGKITKVQFTCENPEYWNSLWRIDPDKVVELYQELTGNSSITKADLSIPGTEDPVTNQPVYNPLNKFNSGTNANTNNGAAIHLTSTPNTLQTEIGLGAASSILRNNPSGGTLWQNPSQNNELLCFGQFGQKHRNSDPNIGAGINGLVNESYSVTIANPPGLYIQMPNFSTYETPDGSDASQYWNIVRGVETIDGLPGNFILHAVYEVPEDKEFCVEDIKINGKNIEWGSQIASTFNMHILATAKTASLPQGYGEVTESNPTFAQPLQLFHENHFNKMYAIEVPNPVNHPISLLSNSTYIPSQIKVGTQANMVFVADTCTAQEGKPDTYPTISFGEGITVEVNSVKENIEYAVPGNSTPSTYTAIFVNVSVDGNTSVGIKQGRITNIGQSDKPALPAMLEITQ